MTTPATALELPPAVQRVADQIERGFRLLSPADAIAGYICTTGEVAEGLAALPLVEKLRARHFWVTIPDRWNSGITDVKVCNACRSAWPCADAEILGAHSAETHEHRWSRWRVADRRRCVDCRVWEPPLDDLRAALDAR